MAADNHWHPRASSTVLIISWACSTCHLPLPPSAVTREHCSFGGSVKNARSGIADSFHATSSKSLAQATFQRSPERYSNITVLCLLTIRNTSLEQSFWGIPTWDTKPIITISGENTIIFKLTFSDLTLKHLLFYLKKR